MTLPLLLFQLHLHQLPRICPVAARHSTYSAQPPSPQVRFVLRPANPLPPLQGLTSPRFGAEMCLVVKIWCSILDLLDIPTPGPSGKPGRPADRIKSPVSDLNQGLTLKSIRLLSIMMMIRATHFSTSSLTSKPRKAMNH